MPPPPTTPTVLVLVGPKGAGKTTIGAFLAEGLGGWFLDAEPIAKRVLAARGGVLDDSYAEAALDAVVTEARAALREHPLVILESTGAARQTEAFFGELEASADRTAYVRVTAPLATCLARIAGRDETRHVPIPTPLVEEMYERSMAVTRPWTACLENEPALGAEEAVARVREGLGGA